MGLTNTAYMEWRDGEYIPAPSSSFNGTEALTRNDDELNAIRGKRYYWLISNLTGISLYNEYIDNTSMKDIAVALRQYLEGCYDDGPNHTEKELTALYRWFKICADNGYFIRSYD